MGNRIFSSPIGGSELFGSQTAGCFAHINIMESNRLNAIPEAVDSARKALNSLASDRDWRGVPIESSWDVSGGSCSTWVKVRWFCSIGHFRILEMRGTKESFKP